MPVPGHGVGHQRSWRENHSPDQLLGAPRLPPAAPLIAPALAKPPVGQPCLNVFVAQSTLIKEAQISECDPCHLDIKGCCPLSPCLLSQKGASQLSNSVLETVISPIWALLSHHMSRSPV